MTDTQPSERKGPTMTSRLIPLPDGVTLNDLPTLSVGKDLDGCHYLFDRAWFHAAVALGEEGFAHDLYESATRWEFYETYGCDLDRFLAICNKAADLGLLWNYGAANMRDGQATWHDLAAEGHRIHVKTDRSFGAHPLASEVATRIWLAATGRRYDTLTFTRDKTTGPPVDLMLEDKIENYDALDAFGVEVWLIDRPWNQDDGTRRRVFSHDEFHTRVRHMQLRRYAAAKGIAADVQDLAGV